MQLHNRIHLADLLKKAMINFTFLQIIEEVRTKKE